MEMANVSRRSFMKGAGLAGLAAAAGGVSLSSLYGCSPTEGDGGADAPAPVEQVIWTHCAPNCGGACPLQCHVVDGEIAYIESDNVSEGGLGGLQARACLRGRSMRRWLNSPDRVMYPMKRVGKRGAGEFERITWDEAIQTVADKLKYTIDTYGNEAVYSAYASGVCAGAVISTHTKLINLMGGCLGYYGDYSTAQITRAMPFTYGPSNGFTASALIEAKNSDLLILFGNSPSDTRMGGGNMTHVMAEIRESIYAKGGKIVNVDYRLNETSSGYPEEWLPIRSGTDAALVSAIAYVLISEDLVNKEFLDEYCVGYDADTMPEGAPANSSYKDYIMGTGYDMTPKTPEWAAPITQIPAEKITELAHDLANAKAAFICQGWGPQRHSNGENTSRAIVMLALLTGNIGLPGTNTGCREPMNGGPVGSFPSVPNPVTTKISCFHMIEAIDHGPEMTALRDGVQGKDKLDVGIKFVWNYAGNFFNQHSDTNHTHEVLQDETKCEFILCVDTVMSASAKYADILLPDTMRSEMMSLTTGGYGEWDFGITFGQKVVEPKFEVMSAYEFNAAVAEKLGVGEAFTEGKTYEEWNQYLYEQAAAADPSLPTWEEGIAMGVYRWKHESSVGLAAYREDPAANPLDTPSGKIEIYSSALAEIANTWELEEDEVITPIPVFDPGFDSYVDATDEFPLVCAGFHYKSRTHSSFGFMDILKESCRQQIWINPADAEPRGIATGDICSVKSAQGEIRIEAKVTPRIIPGVVGIPQGAWYDADPFGDKIDHGGCINTLATKRPSPLAKGNPQHTNLVQVAKA
ncbi:MAG: molybdopterin-dependent oxidoreductase [Eggerthellaceae bacterium]|nr:molybdopterin-dependent oxidoreductase [Eggerthellaceae bacterium]